MEDALYLAYIGYKGIWFSSGKSQLEQPTEYLAYIIDRSSLIRKALVKRKILTQSVLFKNGGRLKLRNLTELNARSSRADFIVYDEEAQADEAAFNAAVSILAGSPLGFVFHISTAAKATIFETNHDRIKLREDRFGTKNVFYKPWYEVSFLAIKREWYEEEKRIKPGWYFRQEHECKFELPGGAVFRNVIYDPYPDWLLEDIRIQPLLSGMDWNPVGGHWLSGGKWLPNLKSFVVSHSLPIAIGYTHQLSESTYLTIKEYCTYGKKLCAESGGINEEYHDWLRLMLSKDRNKRGVNIMWEEWDSQGVNKTNTVLHLLDKTIYIDEKEFPVLAKQIRDCKWKADSTRIEIEKDRADSPHALDAFLHSATKKLIAEPKYRRFDWHE